MRGINKRRLESRNRTIKSQADEISKLRTQIDKLSIDCAEKDELISSVDSLYNEINAALDEIKKERDKYKKLNADLLEMRKIMNKEVFRGRWNLVRLLLR